MAADPKEAPAGEGGKEAPSAPSAPKGPLILALVNTLVILGTLGLLYYTRMMFKRPAITEEAERARIEAAKASPKPAEAPMLVPFESINVNIKSQPGEAKTPEAAKSGMHYVSMTMTLEIRDSSRKEDIEQLRPMIVDRIMAMIGQKTYSELVTVQGRYLLRNEISDMVNDLLEKQTVRKSTVVTNVFLNNFLVQ